MFIYNVKFALIYAQSGDDKLERDFNFLASYCTRISSIAYKFYIIKSSQKSSI